MTSEHEAAGRFQLALGLTPLFARLLAARGWRETEALVEFLHPRLEHTHSPWLLHGMERAVERTQAALAAGEPIRILGDYDADGTLATVVLRQALRSLGGDVSFALPKRLEEGYGLTAAAIERAAAEGVKLAITVDTGIREHAALERARELGLDVIVTDHHLPGAELPPAWAIVNPHQAECRYPDKGLCGTGLAFKLTQALLERQEPAGGNGSGGWTPALRSYLKLVAMATVADAAPLLGENRVLARFGLAGLSEPVNPGLRALLALALPPVEGGAGARAVTSRDVAFRIAPRLNAAGRMGGAEQVVDLFFAPAAEAAQRAQALEALNQQRQQLCDAIEAEIEARLAAEPAEGDVLLLAGEGWHRGVLGIVASRVLAKTGKAAVIVSLEARAGGGAQAHGSGRAPEGLHLLERLEACRELFDRFGGHAQAVGFTLPAARLAQLREALTRPGDGAAAAAAEPAAFELRLGEITPALARDLARLEPYGEANPEPVFVARGVRVAEAPQRMKERHMKLTVEQEGARQTALFWNLWRDGGYQHAPGRPEWEGLRPGTALDLVFRLESGTHPVYGFRQQLILKNFTLASAAAGGAW
jgi:single-stranded-DNA-specific exonuclease